MGKVVQLELPEPIYHAAQEAAKRKGETLQAWLGDFVAKQVKYEELVLKAADRKALLPAEHKSAPGALRRHLGAAKGTDAAASDNERQDG